MRGWRGRGPIGVRRAPHAGGDDRRPRRLDVVSPGGGRLTAADADAFAAWLGPRDTVELRLSLAWESYDPGALRRVLEAVRAGARLRRWDVAIGPCADAALAEALHAVLGAGALPGLQRLGVRAELPAALAVPVCHRLIRGLHALCDQPRLRALSVSLGGHWDLEPAALFAFLGAAPTLETLALRVRRWLGPLYDADADALGRALEGAGRLARLCVAVPDRTWWPFLADLVARVPPTCPLRCLAVSVGGPRAGSDAGLDTDADADAHTDADTDTDTDPDADADTDTDDDDDEDADSVATDGDIAPLADGPCGDRGALLGGVALRFRGTLRRLRWRERWAGGACAAPVVAAALRAPALAVLEVTLPGAGWTIVGPPDWPVSAPPLVSLTLRAPDGAVDDAGLCAVAALLGRLSCLRTAAVDLRRNPGIANRDAVNAFAALPPRLERLRLDLRGTGARPTPTGWAPFRAAVAAHPALTQLDVGITLGAPSQRAFLLRFADGAPSLRAVFRTDTGRDDGCILVR
jgi:hypothetical protein